MNTTPNRENCPMCDDNGTDRLDLLRSEAARHGMYIGRCDHCGRPGLVEEPEPLSYYQAVIAAMAPLEDQRAISIPEYIATMRKIARYANESADNAIRVHLESWQSRAFKKGQSKCIANSEIDVSGMTGTFDIDGNNVIVTLDSDEYADVLSEWDNQLIYTPDDMFDNDDLRWFLALDRYEALIALRSWIAGVSFEDQNR